MRNQKKENNNNWKGGFTFVNGYILRTYKNNKRRLEHRFVMEKYLGHKLSKSECIHHLNGNITDNRIENLILCKSPGEHTKKYHSQNRTNGKYARRKIKAGLER